MSSSWKHLGLFAVLLLVPHISRAGGDDAARQLVGKALEALPKEPYIARLKVSVPGGPSRSLEVRQKFVDGARVTYLEVVAPDELTGVRFLFRQPPTGRNEQFMKLPASRLLVQVSEDVRTQPFLNSTFYVSDLVEPPLDQFDYAFVGEETIGDRKVRLIEARPKSPEGQVYGKTVLAIDPTDLVMVRRQFFDENGTLVKVWTVDKLEKVDGHWTMLAQKMENLPEKAASTLTVESITYGAQLDDQMFTPKYLTR